MPEQDFLIGITSTVLSILFYGSAFTPMRMFSGGDGIFVQWMMTVGQFFPGCYILWSTGFPPIYPFAMLGGCLYTIANCFTIFIMENIGMTLGPLLWNSTCCVVGWAVARYGLFGLQVEEPSSPTINVIGVFVVLLGQIKEPNSPTINVIGVIVVLLGGSLYTLVKTTPSSRSKVYIKGDEIVDHSVLAVARKVSQKLQEGHQQQQMEKEELEKHLVDVPTERRVFCTILSLSLGLLYGNLLTPITLLVQSAERTGLPDTVEPYLFSHFLGGFLSSTVVFILYTCVRKNQPDINPEIALPAMISGALFGAGEVLFFLGSQHLSQVITFPIIAMSPALINTLWGILLFKEIKGARNLAILATAYCVTLCGVTLVVISKVDFGDNDNKLKQFIAAVIEKSFKFNILLLVIIQEGTRLDKYKTALSSLECYSRMQGYRFLVTSDANHTACMQKDFMFRRHCLVAQYYLPTADYLVFLDADMAVVNPKKRFEEFIDPLHDLIFYDRFDNWEVAAGSYIAKNTPYAIEFLTRFADYEKQLPNSFHGTDNGAFHIFFAEEMYPDLKDELKICHEVYNSSQNFDTLFTYEGCVRAVIGSRRELEKIKIYKKGTGWVRDIWLTDSRWNPDRDFLLHALQESRRIPYNPVIMDRESMGGKHLLYYTPFNLLPNLTQCSSKDYEFDLDERLVIPVPQLESILSNIYKRVEKRRWQALGKVEAYIKLAKRK